MDCPGLVFPHEEREELVLFGILNIAQESKVVGVVDVLIGLFGEDWLRRGLGLGPREGSERGEGVCREFAIKKGFKSVGGREDVHRAGNFILRMIVSGKLLVAFRPPI